MKIKEIRENTNEELLAKVKEAEKEIISIRVRKTGADGTSASPVKVRNLRKLVARAKTVITEREKETKAK